MSLAEAKVLGLKAVAKTLDTASISAEKLEMMTITRDPTRRTGEQIIQTVLTNAELEQLIEENKDMLVRKDTDDDEDEEDVGN